MLYPLPQLTEYSISQELLDLLKDAIFSAIRIQSIPPLEKMLEETQLPTHTPSIINLLINREGHSPFSLACEITEGKIDHPLPILLIKQGIVTREDQLFLSKILKEMPEGSLDKKIIALIEMALDTAHLSEPPPSMETIKTIPNPFSFVSALPFSTLDSKKADADSRPFIKSDALTMSVGASFTPLKSPGEPSSTRQLDESESIRSRLQALNFVIQGMRVMDESSLSDIEFILRSGPFLTEHETDAILKSIALPSEEEGASICTMSFTSANKAALSRFLKAFSGSESSSSLAFKLAIQTALIASYPHLASVTPQGPASTKAKPSHPLFRRRTFNISSTLKIGPFWTRKSRGNTAKEEQKQEMIRMGAT